MNTMWALVRHEARDSRFSLVAAMVVSAVVLGVIHAWFATPFAVAQASVMAVLILIPLWTLYFAADLFATDCASGRMSTKALLPVSALTLWNAKIVFLGLTIAGLSISILGGEFVLQWSVGASDAPALFASALPGLISAPSHVSALPFLLFASLVLLLASIAVLCSMLVENALVAMLFSLVVAATFAGSAWAIARALSLADIEWNAVQWLALMVAASAVLLLVSALSFVRGQRTLGLRMVRVKFAIATLVSLVVIGGIGTAGVVLRSVTTLLASPRAQIAAASGSPDGRHLAIEVDNGTGTNKNTPRSVWMIDLDTGEHELVASPAELVLDRYTAEPMPWDSDRSLRVLALQQLDWGSLDALLQVDTSSDALTVTRLDKEIPLNTRLVPAWAEIERSEKSTRGTRTLKVRWTERGIQESFVGDGMSAWVGRGVFLSPTPGRVFVLRDGVVSMHELGSTTDQVLFARDVMSMHPSPDGTAFLVYTMESTTAVSGVDGTPLHEPWPRASGYVQWVSGAARTRAVRMTHVGPLRSEHVVDLDTHVEFDIPRASPQSFLHHLGDRGYVYVDDQNDIVWVDARGALVRVLVKR